MRVAIIKNGIVENVAVWPDNAKDWPVLPDGVQGIASDVAGPSWLWTKKDGFVAPAHEPDVAAVQPEIIVSARQFRLALHELGLLETVEAIVANPATDRSVKIEWEYSTELRRSAPVWEQMLTVAGKTPAELDAVFALAATK